MSTSPPIPWALAGYGTGGRVFHGPLITSAAGLRLAAVVARSAERSGQVGRDLPAAAVVPDLDRLPDLGVVGVTVTTPTATHAEVAHRALELGLHVVVDKPFALTAVAAAALVDHANAVGCLLTVYQNRRWDSDFLTLTRLIADGSLGAVHRFTSRIDRFRPVKPGWSGGAPSEGGGTLLDLGPHLVDQALHLFGPVMSVYAELDVRRVGARAEDDILLSLRHRSGVASMLLAGMASAAPGPRFQVNGDRAGFVVDGFDIQESQLKAGGSPARLGSAWGVEPESAWGTLVTGGDSARVRSERGAWDSFYPAVAAAVRGLGPVPVAAQAAVDTAAVLDAARLSATERRAVQLS